MRRLHGSRLKVGCSRDATATVNLQPSTFDLDARPLPGHCTRCSRAGHRRRPARHARHAGRHPPRLLGRAGRHSPGHARRQDAGSPTWKAASGRAPASRSLKVGYNKVFGYYIEVTQANARARAGRLHPQADAGQRRALHHAGAEGVRDAGPQRRGAHRWSSRASSSGRLRPGRRGRASGCWPRPQALAELDVAAALAEVAAANRYVRPALADDGVDRHRRRPASGGRADRLAGGAAFVPNDTLPLRRRARSSSSPAPTWAASPPICARWR